MVDPVGDTHPGKCLRTINNIAYSYSTSWPAPVSAFPADKGRKKAGRKIWKKRIIRTCLKLVKTLLFRPLSESALGLALPSGKQDLQ